MPGLIYLNFDLAPAQQQMLYIFIGAIVVLFFADLITYYSKKIKHRSFRNEIVTVGILGTFVGIFLGLWDFDVENIRASIPLLLKGMKIAFITSIWGIFCSILMIVVQKIIPSHRDPSINQLSEFFQESKKASDAIVEQVKQHRVESKDALNEINNALEDALNKMSEGATKEIIQALEKVIADFNNNLTEQFGENFKKLNDACLKLVEWQGRYIESIEATEKTLAATVKTLEETSSAVTNIAQRHKEFEKFCNDTALTLETMNTLSNSNIKIQKQLEDSIKILSGMTPDLEKMPPALGKTIAALQAANEKVTEELRETNQKVIDGFEQTNSRLENQIQSSVNSANELNGKMREATHNLNSALVSLTQQFGENYRGFLEQLEKLMLAHK